MKNQIDAMNKETIVLLEKGRAARKIDDELSSIQYALESARALISELTEGYFDCYDFENRDDHIKIAWEYRRHIPYSHMLVDYIYKAQQGIDELLNLSSNVGAIEEKREN